MKFIEMPTKNIESRNEKMSSREQLDNQARKEFFAAQKFSETAYVDSKGDVINLGAYAEGKTMVMTISKFGKWKDRSKLGWLGNAIEPILNMLDKNRGEYPVESSYTLRFGPKGYELIIKDYKKGWTRKRKLIEEAEIRDVLGNFDRRLKEVDKVKHERDAKARRESNKLADAKTQNERDEADQDLAAKLEGEA